MVITVGVPIWNQRKSYFRECLESIKNQTFQNFECIVLDDGSDNKEEVEKITKEFGFKYIYQKNLGIGAARQSLIDNASKESEFICFLSSDDVWDKDFLKIMIETSRQQPDKILYSSNYHMNAKGKIILKFEPPNYDNHEDFCISCWECAKKENMFVNFSTTFFPKKVFKKVGFDKDLRFGEDLDFLLRSMKHFEYYLVNNPLLYYRAEGNLTSKIMDKIPKQNIMIRKKCMEYWNEK